MIAIDKHFKGIRKFEIPTDCNYLDLGNNKLKSLELNENLIFLNCFGNKLSTLKLSKNIQILMQKLNLNKKPLIIYKFTKL